MKKAGEYSPENAGRLRHTEAQTILNPSISLNGERSWQDKLIPVRHAGPT